MAVVVPQTYYVVLSRNNNFESNETLTAPFYNVTSCRILANSLAYIQANFLFPSYVLSDTNDGELQYLDGFALAGDPMLWYKVKLNSILQPVIKLYNDSTFEGDSLQLCFQFQ